jgi:hypothetical protein
MSPSPPSLQFDPLGATNAFVHVWLPRVRDVTRDVIAHLGVIPSTPPRRTYPTPPSDWEVPPATTRFIADPPVNVGGAIQVEGPMTVDPATDDLVFEIQGFRAPRLIAMCWPNAYGFPMGPRDPNATFLQAAPAPFLIFFHAQHGQGMGAEPPQGPFYMNGPHPYGWDFLYYGLYRYLVFPEDAIGDYFAKGLPIQVRQAGRNCIVLVPQNRFGPRGPADEIIEFNDPDLVQETLEEIQVYMYFRAGRKFARPNVGRTAAAALSNGNVLLTAFLNSHPDRPFLRNIVREIYIFDPNGDSHALNAAPVEAALAWARSDPSDKMIRYFAQQHHPVHDRLLGVAPPSGNFVQDGTNPNFTGGVLSESAWIALGARDTSGWQAAHQLIPSMLLTHAMRKSGF